MTVTDQQLRALTYLALACRPVGAPRWDEAGTYANIAKVRDRSLPMLIIAVINAAADRKLASPGVIPKPGPHWSAGAEDAVQAAEARRPFDPEATCEACYKPRRLCESIGCGNFVPVSRRGTLPSLAPPETVRAELRPLGDGRPPYRPAAPDQPPRTVPGDDSEAATAAGGGQ